MTQYSNQDNVISFYPDKSLGNLPPQNIVAEEAILGGIMLEDEVIANSSDAYGGKQRLSIETLSIYMTHSLQIPLNNQE
ncbi:hypothetical protein [Nostoc sp. CHAB 5715]|uniref:hypothetical protein n=1 Tax=Nostoc sp. CHAB 5715 TaxID=2780400 RepID=UPI001E39C402|nr:hypothetical protein [Nostoc sp. CHAB 5715]MCC5622726.1 hypothetical protein [Nostoc sp. CHAB 5715]